MLAHRPIARRFRSHFERYPNNKTLVITEPVVGSPDRRVISVLKERTTT